MAEFVNPRIDRDELPRIRSEDFIAVHPNLLRVSLIGRAIAAAMVLAIGITVSVLVPSNAWVPLLVMVVVLGLIGLSAVLRAVEVRNIAYLVRAHDLSYRSGVLVKAVSTIPFVRVQHARIRQGPVQRRFGISTLEINSAGPDLNIDGLASDVAERLKALVVERAGDLAEES